MRFHAFLVVALIAGAALAGEAVSVAVAGNFRSTATHLAARYFDETGVAIRLSSGSTGKLYAQIVNGAPFDVFLSADAERPILLEQAGLAVSDSRFTYATGRLVLFSVSASDCLAALRDPGAGHVALANPATAPYGRATKQYLEREGLWNDVSIRAVYGESITQAWQFASTGNAVVGFAAQSQLKTMSRPPTCSYALPSGAHEALEQQAVLLDENNRDAVAFLEFLRSDIAREIIEQDGYGVPQ